MAPLISIIVPCYNEGRLILPALESIQKQSFEDFEVVIGDDASTDGTAALAEKFCSGDSRFRVSRASVNVGMTRNWNRLLRECNGRYVAKLDADDAFQPHVLARLKEALESQKLSVAFCRTIDCDDELQPLGSYYGERAFILRGIEPREDHVRDGASWLDICFDGYQLWHSSSFLATRELLTDLQGWDERWGCAADTDLIHRILHHESRVASIGYPGLLYRRRSGSIFDGYKKRNWFKTEVLTVLLLSLHRMSSSGMVKSIRLRKTWGGLWLAREAALAELDATNRDFAAANADVPKPPWPYVTAYRVREAIAASKNRWLSC